VTAVRMRYRGRVRLASSDSVTTEEAEPDEAKGHKHAVGEHSHAEEEHTSRPGIAEAAEAAETAEALQQEVAQAGSEEQSRSPVPKVTTTVMAEGATAPANAAKALQQGVEQAGTEEQSLSPAPKVAPPVIVRSPTASANVAMTVVDDSGTRSDVAQPADRTPPMSRPLVTAGVDIPSEGSFAAAVSGIKADDLPSPGVQQSAVPVQHNTSARDRGASISPSPLNGEKDTGSAVPLPKASTPEPRTGYRHDRVLSHDDDTGVVKDSGATTTPTDPRSRRPSPRTAARAASTDVEQTPTAPTVADTAAPHVFTPSADADATSGSSDHSTNQPYGADRSPAAETRSASSDGDTADRGPVLMTLPVKESVDRIEGSPSGDGNDAEHVASGATATLSYSPQADHHAPNMASQSDDPLDRLFSDLLLECDPRFSINLTDESLDEILGAEYRRGLGHGGVHIPGILPRAPAHEVHSATSASNDLLLPSAVESSQPRQPNQQQHDLRVGIAASSSPSTAAASTTPSPPGRHTPSIMASRYLSASKESLRSFSTGSSLSIAETKRRSPRSATTSTPPARTASPRGGKKTEQKALSPSAEDGNAEAALEGEHRPVAASRPAAQTTVAVKTPPRELQRRDAKTEVTVTPPQAGRTEDAPCVETAEPPTEPVRVFMVHGISRRRFTEDEVTQLATLPQPLHVTHTQDHAKFIVGYEHAPEGNRVTSEGYLTLYNTSAPECTFQLVASG
jgi:hypothetical protein